MLQVLRFRLQKSYTYKFQAHHSLRSYQYVILFIYGAYYILIGNVLWDCQMHVFAKF